MFVLSLVCVMFVGCYITPASASTSFALNEDIAAVFGRIGMSLCRLLFTFSVYMYVISTSYDLHSFVVFIELDMCPVSDPPTTQPCDVHGNLSVIVSCCLSMFRMLICFRMMLS